MEPIETCRAYPQLDKQHWRSAKESQTLLRPKLVMEEPNVLAQAVGRE